MSPWAYFLGRGEWSELFVDTARSPRLLRVRRHYKGRGEKKNLRRSWSAEDILGLHRCPWELKEGRICICERT